MQAKAAFSSDIDKNIIHSSVRKFQSYIDSIIEGLRYISGCCGLFALEKESQIFAIDDYLIDNSITLELLTISNIDSCGISDNGICFCLT